MFCFNRLCEHIPNISVQPKYIFIILFGGGGSGGKEGVSAVSLKRMLEDIL